MTDLLHDPGFYGLVFILTVFTIFHIWADGKHKEYIEHKRQAKEAAA
jgi:hypothetical protein